MFSNRVYAGLLAAVAVGIYLFQLWTPQRQVELHSRGLLAAIEDNDGAELSQFLADTYQDDWGHDKALVLSRLKQVVRYARGGQLVPHNATVQTSDTSGEWRGRITIEAEANELTAPLLNHVNAVTDPWVLQWQRQSWKPWDWKLVRVSNPGFELPRQLGW